MIQYLDVASDSVVDSDIPEKQNIKACFSTAGFIDNISTHTPDKSSQQN